MENGNVTSENLSFGWTTAAEAAQTAHDMGLSAIPCRARGKKAAGYAHSARSILPEKLTFAPDSSIALMGGYGGLLAIDADEGGEAARALSVEYLGEPIAVIAGRPGRWKLLYKASGYVPPPPELEALARAYVKARYAAANAVKEPKREAREKFADDTPALEAALKTIEAEEKALYQTEHNAFRDAADPWIESHGLPRTRTAVKGNGLKFDILSFYSLIVAPPSIHEKTGLPYRWEGETLTKERFDAATPVTLEQLNAFCDAVQPRTKTPTRPEIPRAREVAAPTEEGTLPQAVARLLPYIEQGRGEGQGEHINRFRICAALFNHFGDDAKEYARKWRMQVEAPSYNEANFEKMWASASTPHTGPKVGLGTLVRWAREGGWQGRLAPEWVHFTGDAKSPKPRTDSPRNVEILLCWIGVDARLDKFAGDVYLHGRNKSQLFDQDTLNSLHCEAHDIGFHIAKKTLAECVRSIASEHKYHPVQDYLRGLKHEGTRCEEVFIKYLGAEDNAYTRAVSRLFFAAAVRRILNPGCKFDFMLILYGEQGKGKSTFFEILAGDWHTSSLPIGAEPQKTLIESQGVWIAESAELSGMRRRDVETLKEFITRRADKAALKFENAVTHRPRQFVMVGTTNDEKPLLDNTGGRRFLILPVFKSMSPQDFEKLQAERDAIWADAVQIEKHYGPLVLPESIVPLARERQEAARYRSELEERAYELFGRLGFGRVAKDDFYRACGLNPGQVNDAQKRAVEHAAKIAGWYLPESKNRRRLDGGGRVRIFERPTPKGGTPLWTLGPVTAGEIPQLECALKEFEAEIETYHLLREIWGGDVGEDLVMAGGGVIPQQQVTEQLCGHFTV